MAGNVTQFHSWNDIIRSSLYATLQVTCVIQFKCTQCGHLHGSDHTEECEGCLGTELQMWVTAADLPQGEWLTTYLPHRLLAGHHIHVIAALKAVQQIRPLNAQELAFAEPLCKALNEAGPSRFLQQEQLREEQQRGAFDLERAGSSSPNPHSQGRMDEKGRPFFLDFDGDLEKLGVSWWVLALVAAVAAAIIFLFIHP